MHVNPLVQAIEAPPIPQAHGWAARYDGRFGPLLDCCQAVPGYPPHPALLERAAAEAGARDNARYGLIPGDLALREAYAAEVSARYGGRVEPDQVAITAGCNQAFFLAVMTLCERGDNVVLPVPWFWNHQQTCGMLGVEVRPLPCRAEAGFVPAVDDLPPLLDGRTRAVVLISPNNPTGAVYPPPVIEAFHRACAERGVALILDETYLDFLPDGQERAHGLFEGDWEREGLVQLYSFSKAFCVPGHRVGAVVASRELVREFVKVLDCLHICPQRGAQGVLGWALGALGSWRAGNRATINARAAAVRSGFADLDGWDAESVGAYFAYVRHPFPGRGAMEVAERVAVELGAVGLPGSAFGPGQDGFLRLAFANLELDGVAELVRRLRLMGAG